MIRAIALTCTNVGLILAALDVFGWTALVEKLLQDWKGKVLAVAAVIAPRQGDVVPQAHKDVRDKFWKRIYPYQLALSLAIWLGFTVYLMRLWYSNYHPPEVPGWGEFIGLMLFLLILGLIVGLLLTFGTLIAIALAVGFSIVWLASLFELLAIPRRGIVAMLVFIVTATAWVIDVFFH